jgi:hypothetical protein
LPGQEGKTCCSAAVLTHGRAALKLAGNSSRAIVAGSQLSYRSVDIGLTPQQSRAVVEDVEVVSVVSLLLNDLEFDIFIVDVWVPER